MGMVSSQMCRWGLKIAHFFRLSYLDLQITIQKTLIGLLGFGYQYSKVQISIVICPEASLISVKSKLDFVVETLFHEIQKNFLMMMQTPSLKIPNCYYEIVKNIKFLKLVG